MPGQSIRPSQFVFSHGVGSILEMSEGPRLVPAFGLGLFLATGKQNLSPYDYRIPEQRLTTSVLRALGGPNPFIFRLPTNAEIGVPEAETVYRTMPFPEWSLCGIHHILFRHLGTAPQVCPRCTDAPQRLGARARKEADRFVLACPAGHMDSVPWHVIVPHKKEGCPARFYVWTGGGAGLRNVVIECVDCKGSIVLGRAYGRDYTCLGRLPENGTGHAACGEKARITQRLATNLRIPELVSALTIPPNDGPVHKLLLANGLDYVFSGVDCKSKTQALDILRHMVERRRLSEAVLQEVASVDEPELIQAIDDVTHFSEARTQDDIKDQEFHALQSAARYGHPSNRSRYGEHRLEVVRSEVRTINTSHGHTIRVAPVRRLEVVTVQVGYRRRGTDPVENQLRVTSFESPPPDNRVGFPGVAMLGEGVFVDIPGGSPFTSGNLPFRSDWQRASSKDERVTWPESVWWHTLSHALLNALSLDSGYAAPAIRERIYVTERSSAGPVEGGVLLYTSQPGGDGSLGGLIAQVTRFERILDTATYSLDPCANDPLCSENRFAKGKVNGAACYACCLVSETSCELRNRGLDRNLLLESLP